MSERERARLLLLAAFLGCVIGSSWVSGLAFPAFVIAVMMWCL